MILNRILVLKKTAKIKYMIAKYGLEKMKRSIEYDTL